MSISKAWDWTLGKSPAWLAPSEECYYIADRWKKAGFKKLLDFGCGLGRHAVFFAKEGFDVSAFDLSEAGAAHLRDWASREKLSVDVRTADMLALPYGDEAFDGLFAYHVISHTDTKGMQTILKEIRRVLRPGGEFYLTLCSKAAWLYGYPDAPRLDENTLLKTEDGPEKGVPHFFVDLDDIFGLFKDFELINVRHIEDCSVDREKHTGVHYYILGRKPAPAGAAR